MSDKPRLKERYVQEIVPGLKKEFDYKSVMQVPKLQKIVINQGVGEATSDKRLVDFAIEELSQISGQKAVITYSRHDISNFKLRKGMPIGARVTLRGKKMYEFLDRLISAALPRTRDFRGVSIKGFDGRGNYTFGVKEQIIFPEINIDKINSITGMNVTLVTSAKTDNEAKALLTNFGFPLAK